MSSSDYSSSTNRFGSSLATYDNAGNITTDSKFRSLNYAYDANGRQASASNGSWTETQTYDCAGQRVQTSVGGTTRTMVYDLFGQEVADYANGVLERENIYRGGQLLATTSTQTQLTASSASASNYISGNEPGKAIDGNVNTLWNSGGFPSQWITIDLGQLSTVSKVRLLIAQSPTGSTTHELYGGATTSNLSSLGSLSGSTQNGQWLEFDPNTSNIRYLKVLTTSSPSWVAWSEIEVYGSNSATTNYVLTDAQGSARSVMNNNGSSSSVIARHDYLPFGEEIGAGIGLRTTGQGYSVGDGIRQKYAQTERDSLTGLDHTWWRKYESLSGRWTSPDPYAGSMSVADPQSFNRYSYTQNDPVNFVDPSGLLCFGWFERLGNGQWVFRGVSRCISLPGEDNSDPIPVEPSGIGAEGDESQSGGAILSAGNQNKFNSARDKARRRIEKLEKKGKSKCAELLGRAGISLDALEAAVNSIQAFDGGSSTDISIGEAGAIDLQDPEFQSLSGTRQAQVLSEPVSSLFPGGSSYGAVTGSNGWVFFNTRSGLNSNSVFHEALHVASGLGDVRLAQALRLKSSGSAMGASQAINQALRDYGCNK